MFIQNILLKEDSSLKAVEELIDQIKDIDSASEELDLLNKALFEVEKILMIQKDNFEAQHLKKRILNSIYKRTSNLYQNENPFVESK
jgi:hypothetical protein